MCDVSSPHEEKKLVSTQDLVLLTPGSPSGNEWEDASMAENEPHPKPVLFTGSNAEFTCKEVAVVPHGYRANQRAGYDFLN